MRKEVNKREKKGEKKEQREWFMLQKERAHK